MLAPLLIIGGRSALWSASGCRRVTPAWAMVAMAGMMGGTMRSPLTGMFFMLELTADFNALPALLCGSVAALGVTVLLMRLHPDGKARAARPAYRAGVQRARSFELMRVGEVMEREFALIPATTPLAQYADRLANADQTVGRHQGTMLANEAGELVGIVTRGDVVKAIGRAPGTELTVLEAGQTQLVVTYPDETLHDAISKLLRHNIGRLPVVSRAEPRRVIGYLGRAGILAARRRSHQEETVRERGLKGRGRVALEAAQP